MPERVDMRKKIVAGMQVLRFKPGRRVAIRYFGILMLVAFAMAVIAISPVAPTTHTAEAQSGICGRTPQIRDEILRQLSVTDCSTVTSTQLATIRDLNVRNTGIRSLKNGDFGFLTDLRRLHLQENHFSTLPQGFWDDMAEINEVYFSNNNLTVLDDDFLRKADGSASFNPTTLKVLDFSGNQITSVSANAFDGAISIETLNLENNKIATIAGGAFDGLGDILTLKLGQNELETLPNLIFHKVRADKATCDADNPALPQQNVNRNLSTLELQRNKLTSLPNGVIECFRNLRYLKLDHNNLETLPDDFIKYNWALQWLDLGYNRLTTLPTDFVKENQRLEHLNLSNNQLTSLDGAAFHETKARGIIEFDISNNLLTQLPDRYVTAFLDRADASNGFCLLNFNIGGNPLSEEWIQSGKLNDFLTKYGSYNPRGPAHNDEDTECRLTTRWPYYLERFDGRFLFGSSGTLSAGRFNIFEDIAIHDVTGVEALGLAGIDLSHVVTDAGMTSWELLLAEFVKDDSFDEIFDLSFGWDGLTIDNDMLDELPLQLERLEVKDATFSDNISSRAGRGFKRFDATGINEVYNRIDNIPSKFWLRGPEDVDQLRPAHIYFAQLPIETHTGFQTWYEDRGDGLQSLVLDNVGLTGDGAAVLSRLPEDSMRWLEIRNIPGLTEINSNIKSLSNLYGLEIENTGIESVDGGAFSSLSKLSYLGLGNNEITGVDAGAFDTLSDLQILLLNDNEISDLFSGTLNGLQKLENLYLQNNDIAGIPARFFTAVDRAAASKNADGTDRRVFGEYVFPLEQLILDGNPGAPFHINVDVNANGAGPDQNLLEIREGAPYRFETDILDPNDMIDKTITVIDGALMSDAFEFPMGGTNGIAFLDEHPNRPSDDNRDCLGHSVCYSGFEFMNNPTARLIDIKLSSPPQHYGVGEKINFQARYTEEVDVTGSPTISFTIANPPDKTATYAGVSSVSPNILNFEYTVHESDVGRTGVDTRNSVIILEVGSIVRATILGADGQAVTNTVLVPRKSAVSGIAFVPAGQGTGTTPDGVLSTALIKRIEPSIRNVSLRSGEVVRLGVDAYGRQDALDNGLLDDASIDWDDNNAGGSFDGSGDRVVYTAPSVPGKYTVTASLQGRDCREDADTDELECSASFEITVRRSSVQQPEEPAPVNPAGVIPTILTDNRGNNYEVFTPVDGGSFDAGEGFSITASAGDVPNGEIIGVRMTEGGAASNLGMTHQRYTLGGNTYQIHVVDSAGTSVDAYILDQPAEVCIPLPAALSTNISKIAMAALNSDGTLTILSATTRIGGSTPSVCGNVSNLPATVAAGIQGAPAAIPTPTPAPEPTTPDTGATAPSAQSTLWLMLLGIATATLAVGVLIVARRRNFPLL